MAAGLRWVDGSYLLFVEPRLVGNLDVVSVRVADVCREVVGTPFGPKARFLDCSSSHVYRRLVAGPDSVRALGGECDVKVFGDFAILQPETRLAIDGETEKSIELVRHVDAKRLKHLLIDFTRSFQVRDGEIDMVNHGLPPFVSLLQHRGSAQAILLKSFYLLPPFAQMISPVSQPASSEARNTATRAMSSGWPKRPSGVLAITCFLNSAPMTPAACAPSVSVPPGLRALTRIFLGPNSFESTRVKPLTALFNAT